MTYQEAESFLFHELQSFQDKGRVAFNGTLDNAIALSEILGHPHTKFKSIHIAGTNGKGSVSHMIAAGLQANGYKVGLYTSPHYKTYRERIKIDGNFISEYAVSQFIEKHKADIIRIKPSFFEITCAMAFDHFAKNEVDVAVIEVGLGGRLDSTNIIDPLLSVVTNISYDHQNILGNTLEEIAGEKAGIFKPNTPAIIGEQQEDTSPVFILKAKEVDTDLYYAEQDSSLIHEYQNISNLFTFTTASEEWKFQFESHLSSPYQVRNLQTALYALYHLKNKFDLNQDKIARGIKYIHSLTYFIGRWSTIQENPKVIFDSAHNTAGVQYLAEQVQNMEYKTLRVVWGTTKEKDVDEILTLLPKDAVYYFAKADNSRALDADLLREKAREFGLDGYSYGSVKVAYRVALADAGIEDLILVAGSTFVVAEVI